MKLKMKIPLSVVMTITLMYVIMNLPDWVFNYIPKMIFEFIFLFLIFIPIMVLLMHKD